jgi:hypothetical protein
VRSVGVDEERAAADEAEVGQLRPVGLSAWAEAPDKGLTRYTGKSTSAASLGPLKRGIRAC